MTNCISKTLLSDYNRVEQWSCHIDDFIVVVYWEHICTVYKFFYLLIFINLGIYVKSQVFSLTEKLAALCED